MLVEVNEKQKVISTGPYGVVRHPMYSGALVMLLFIPLALGSFWGLLAFPPILLAVAVRLREEEKYPCRKTCRDTANTARRLGSV